MVKRLHLDEALKRGYMINRLEHLDSYGTYGRGLIVYAGFQLTDKKTGVSALYTAVFTSAGYGMLYKGLSVANGRFKDKYYQYLNAVDNYLLKRGYSAINAEGVR